MGNLPGMLASLLGAAAFGVGALALIYEAWALGHGWTPITGYVRAGIARWPHVAFAGAILLGLVLGHLFWP